MDFQTKQPKRTVKKGKNEEAPADEMIFGGGASEAALEMVNFGGASEEFGEKQREHNVIRKLLNTTNSFIRFALPVEDHQEVPDNRPGPAR